MREAIGAVLPFAVVVMVSPVNIIAAILLLFSRRPLVGAGAYLAGFATGVAAVAVSLDAIAGSLDWSKGSDPSHAAAVVRILLGLLLLRAAVRKVRGHQAAAEHPKLPRWMEGISSLSPSRAAATGFGIGAFNPKNLAMALAASFAVGAADLSAGDIAVVTAVYVVVACLGVAAPLIVSIALGDRSTEVLEGWRTWLVHNNDVVMAVLFFVFAAVLIGNGIASY